LITNIAVDFFDHKAKGEGAMEKRNELLTIEKLKNCVYIIRGQQVMLDHDLAEIYGYEVKNLNRQVKRNSNRFPEDFMFQLTEKVLLGGRAFCFIRSLNPSN
jgi:hypothetical protein